MILIPPENWRHHTLPDGRVTASVACPGCGTRRVLEEHEIAPGGRVSPSLECDTSRPGNDPDEPAVVKTCHFHDVVFLAGWKALEPRPESGGGER